ncbi:hypothetical protein [Spiroplasma alleghenense]|uniref:Uncharacterized protein n=1 Tax=Spiroplasma alleghenense TaxID=216931 RepID=A0A345Z4Q4_9MOLU|nr:hypothetical protein [Spiroplasma alleghenense]AXK51583.1 hypothetical protein SALLE_v1c09130 [Spiroplasma alleghenense]
MKSFIKNYWFAIAPFINFLLILIFFIFYLFFASNGINFAKNQMQLINLNNLKNLLEEDEYYIVINEGNESRVESILDGVFQDAFSHLENGLSIVKDDEWTVFIEEFTSFQKYENNLNYFDFALEILNLPTTFLSYQCDSFRRNDYKAVFSPKAIASLNTQYYESDIINNEFWVDFETDYNYFVYQKIFTEQMVKTLMGIINQDLETPEKKILSKNYSQSKNYYLNKRLENFEIFLKNYEIKNYLNNLLISCYMTVVWMPLFIIEIIYGFGLMFFLRFSENYYFHKYIQVIDR